jgi:hypothetical protein
VGVNNPRHGEERRQARLEPRKVFEPLDRTCARLI